MNKEIEELNKEIVLTRSPSNNTDAPPPPLGYFLRQTVAHNTEQGPVVGAISIIFG